jgi:hypothetical protein
MKRIIISTIIALPFAVAFLPKQASAERSVSPPAPVLPPSIVSPQPSITAPQPLITTPQPSITAPQHSVISPLPSTTSTQPFITSPQPSIVPQQTVTPGYTWYQGSWYYTPPNGWSYRVPGR